MKQENLHGLYPSLALGLKYIRRLSSQTVGRWGLPRMSRICGHLVSEVSSTSGIL